MTLKKEDLISVLTANRGRKGHLSPICRAVICALVIYGQSIASVARDFHVSRATVRTTVEGCTTQRTFESAPRSGRPSVLTKKEKQYIFLLVKKDPRLAKKALVNATGKSVSYSTIRRCLRAHNIRKWRAQKRIPLTKEGAKDRFDFALDWKDKEEELMEVCSLEVALSFSYKLT
jgi:transposase